MSSDVFRGEKLSAIILLWFQESIVSRRLSSARSWSRRSRKVLICKIYCHQSHFFIEGMTSDHLFNFYRHEKLSVQEEISLYILASSQRLIHVRFYFHHWNLHPSGEICRHPPRIFLSNGLLIRFFFSPGDFHLEEVWRNQYLANTHQMRYGASTPSHGFMCIVRENNLCYICFSPYDCAAFEHRFQLNARPWYMN